MGRLDFLNELRERLEKGGGACPKALESPQGAWIVVDGARMLNLASNNYLGLANHPYVKAKAQQALEQFGAGAGGARLISGTTSLHLELERRLAHFKGREKALIFGSGMHANLGIIPAISGEADVILTDELNHGSIIDGCRLSHAKRQVYRHADTADLKRLLEENMHARRRLIVTDGVFSMDGDLAPLSEIVSLADRYDAFIMVDDAHGEGVLGDHGRGIANHFGVEDRVDIEVGTFSKAFGVVGGFVSADAELIDYLSQTARTYLLSTALPPSDIAACIAAMDILEESDHLVKKLWDNRRYFVDGLQNLGFDTGASQTPIVPIVVGAAEFARELERRLGQAGVFIRAVTYPTVPRDKARLRAILSAAHSREDLDFTLERFEQIRNETQFTRLAARKEIQS